MVKIRTLVVPISIFIAALIVRTIIFYGTKVPTGDAGEFATFEREIYLNNGMVPAFNSVYYPGSLYIYRGVEKHQHEGRKYALYPRLVFSQIKKEDHCLHCTC